MATKKAAKKAAKGAKKAGKKSAQAASKKAGKASSSAGPAKKATEGKPAAKKHPPRKTPGKGYPRSEPLIVQVDESGLTFQEPAGPPVPYEMVLLVDQTNWTPAQQAAVEAFVAEMGLKKVALGRGWGGP